MSSTEAYETDETEAPQFVVGKDYWLPSGVKVELVATTRATDERPAQFVVRQVVSVETFDPDYGAEETEAFGAPQIVDRLCFDEPKEVECAALISARHDVERQKEFAAVVKKKREEDEAAREQVRAETEDLKRILAKFRGVEELKMIEHMIDGADTHFVIEGAAGRRFSIVGPGDKWPLSHGLDCLKLKFLGGGKFSLIAKEDRFDGWTSKVTACANVEEARRVLGEKVNAELRESLTKIRGGAHLSSVDGSRDMAREYQGQGVEIDPAIFEELDQIEHEQLEKRHAQAVAELEAKAREVDALDVKIGLAPYLEKKSSDEE